MKNTFTGTNWGAKQIDLRSKDSLVEMRPTEVHYKEDGAKDNGPSIAIVLEHPDGSHVVGQLSMAMFEKGMSELGFKIVKS